MLSIDTIARVIVNASAMFINSFSGILAGYTDRKVLVTAPWRGQAHKAMPIQVALTLAGSLESVVINVNVQL